MSYLCSICYYVLFMFNMFLCLISVQYVTMSYLCSICYYVLLMICMLLCPDFGFYTALLFTLSTTMEVSSTNCWTESCSGRFVMMS